MEFPLALIKRKGCAKSQPDPSKTIMPSGGHEKGGQYRQLGHKGYSARIPSNV